MCMAAIMTDSWEAWNNLTVPDFLLNPTLHSKYLRLNALSCLVENQIDVTLNSQIMTAQSAH